MTSESSVRDGQDIPQLKFASKHKEAILAGEKTMTIRLHVNPHTFQLGRSFALCDETGEQFASAFVEKRTSQTVESLASSELDGHRQYTDANDLTKEMEQYYPDAELTSESTLETFHWGDLTI